MSNVALFVGVDYHQDNLQVCVMDGQANVRHNRGHGNDVAAVAELLRGLGNVRAVAIEACCGAADFGQKLAEGASWRVELAHPGYVARLKRSPDKTDFSDARLLADLSRVGYLPRVWLAPASVRDLRQLVHHRQRLVDQRRAAKLQVGAVLREQRLKLHAPRWSKAWVAMARDNGRLSEQGRFVVDDLLDELEHLNAKVHKVEARLRQVTQGDALVARLRDVEGIGEVTAWYLAAYVADFSRFKNGKQLSRYCGLSPRNASSGQKQADAGLIDAANKPLRAVLLQAAWRLARTHQRWAALFQRLVRKGKPKPLAVAAVANRWVRSLHHRLRDAAAAAGQ